MMFIQNLRIGTKLAVTSALTIGLVALMIVLQMSGDAEVQKLSTGASGQQAIAQNAAEAKASVRGMQIGIRDIPDIILSGGVAEGRHLFQRPADGGVEIRGRNGKALALAGKSQADRPPCCAGR